MIYPEHKPLLKDVSNRYRTKSLFREAYDTTGFTPLWTLQDEDPQGLLPSLKAVYLASMDPTEYDFALEAFGSWNHWVRIRANKWVQGYYLDWPIELEIKLRSIGLKQVTLEAQSGKSSFNAAKFLAQGSWKAKSGRGRPSKEEIEREKKIMMRLDTEIGDDAERLGLKLVASNNE